MADVRWTKAEALTALEDEYQKTIRAVQEYADEDFDTARHEGGMTAKDILAHLAWWNWEAPSGLERIKRDEMPFWAHMELDELNAGTLEECRGWPIRKVMDDLRRSHAVLVSALEQVTDEEFGRSTTHKYSEGTLDGMVWFAYIYIEHYEEHRAQILAG